MIVEAIKQAAEEVYRELGNSHSESVYETSMGVELALRELERRHQVPCIVTYKGYAVGTGFVDILVNGTVVVEIKAVSKLSNKDEQQVRKYLEATGLEQGLLVNFGNTLEIVEVKTNVDSSSR